MKIGLLPFYIKLYDDSLPQMREHIDAFHNLIIDEFAKRDIQVIKVPACRIKQEFADAIKTFETQDADAIVTLHLAYSPSLESSDALSSTELPVIVLNTTPTYSFSPGQNPDEILYNHAIHGVQDMCNLLVRNKKTFLIETGHWEKSDVLDRIVVCIKAAKLAKNIRHSKVGIVGEPFAGMGDFAVPPADLHSQIGIETVRFTQECGKRYFSEITEDEIEAEISCDLTEFETKDLKSANHRQSVISGLILRKWIEKEGLSAMTVNFLSVGGTSGLPCMPFLEISKAMARGIGYAGEGDILTAALVGALLGIYPQTSFTEMFCADWEGDSIFLSHMGEMNLKVSDGKPKLIAKDFPYTDAADPVAAYARFKGGDAVFVNLAPSQDGTFTLITVSGEMLDVKGKDNMDGTIHGWFRPKMPISDFLTMYSIAGGTHHGAVVYGNVKDELQKFGRLMGWKVI
ncbi:MAG: L-arabinose isomerase family protein [Saccharofermentanales bacterium]